MMRLETLDREGRKAAELHLAVMKVGGLEQHVRLDNPFVGTAVAHDTDALNRQEDNEGLAHLVIADLHCEVLQ